MKKVLCVVLTLVLVLAMSAPVFATGTGKVRLSELSDEECIDFLKESGVEIPAIFENELTWAYFVRETIKQVEANPNIVFLYNYSVLFHFSNDIKAAVNAYYGIPESVVTGNTRSVVDILQDSVPWGNWSDDYLLYGTYAYALGVTDDVDPGEFYWLSMVGETGFRYNGAATEDMVASWVEDDLESLLYTVNSVTKTMPNTEVTAHTHLICLRVHSEGINWYIDENGQMVKYHDYHLMKLSENGNWYHKPYYTMPLRYKYTPSNNRTWLSEGCVGEDRNVVSRAGIVYDSDIWFIEYTTPHTYEYQLCGVNQHIRTCTICGETTGSATSCFFVNNVCKFCGHTKIG